MTSSKRSIAVLCLALCGLCAAEARAFDALGNGRLAPDGLISGGEAQRERLSPSDAARVAQQQNGGGRVLTVDRGADGYRVKLLKNGDVRVVFVPGS
ncbi:MULTISPECIES: hypothetical protein [Hydrocarboniphaga]|uniref:hypothetical protein n=1 Tax=Hydrocarboniphaga TaxID=243627 RepID=UPI00058D8D75|nr:MULTISPECIES: hypothetical protein [Hydrocarboniphaga]MDZ4080725.1 hypothetical protein [Hydrocarboniphaga sp.]